MPGSKVLLVADHDCVALLTDAWAGDLQHEGLVLREGQDSPSSPRSCSQNAVPDSSLQSPSNEASSDGSAVRLRLLLDREQLYEIRQLA